MMAGLALLALLGVAWGQGGLPRFNPETVPRLEMMDFVSFPSQPDSGFGSFTGMAFQEGGDASEWFTLSNTPTASGDFQYFSLDGTFSDESGLAVSPNDVFTLPMSSSSGGSPVGPGEFQDPSGFSVAGSLPPRGLNFGGDWLYFANNNFSPAGPRIVRFKPKTPLLDTVFIPHVNPSFVTEGFDTIVVGKVKFLYILTNTKVMNKKGETLYYIEEWALPGSVFVDKSGKPAILKKAGVLRVFPYVVQKNFFAVAIVVFAPFKINIVEAKVKTGGIGFSFGKAVTPKKINIYLVHLPRLGVPSIFNLFEQKRGQPIIVIPKFFLAVVRLVIDKFAKKALIIFTDFKYKTFVRYVPTFFAHKKLPFFNGLTKGPVIGGKGSFMLCSQNSLDNVIPSSFLLGAFRLPSPPSSDVEDIPASAYVDSMVGAPDAAIESFIALASSASSNF